MGDAAGIGPEIAVRAMACDEVTGIADCVAVGDLRVLENALAITGTALTPHVIASPGEGDYRPGVLNLIDLHNIAPDEFEFGQVNGRCGRAAYEAIVRCIELAMARQADAVATTPINKESLRAGGVNFIGHTEIFGAHTHTPDPLTMFETNGLRVFFLTRHVSLREVPGLIRKERVYDCAIRCLQALDRLGVREGVMAIAGLNPHCGEHGLFGREEVEEIVPAVQRLQAEGYPVVGPVGADSVFHQAAQGKYNSVLSLYHDQGHIAAKTLDFERTISVTNGMPILRTSVDHGTAFDLAWTGRASAVSMIEAIRLAAKYAPCFGRGKIGIASRKKAPFGE